MRNLNVNGLMNYCTLLVQAVELLSGGKVGNITINGTVCKYTNHTSYSIILCHLSFISAPSIIIPPVNPPIQVLSEGFNCDNIIVAYNYSSMALLLHLTGTHTKTSCKIIQDSYMNLASRHLHSVSAYHLASFLQDCCKIIMILVS